MSELTHSIGVAAKRTGLSPHVIRIWERRYGAVEPSRTESNRRFYSEAEVERLGLLRQVTLAGHAIGSVAKLSVGDLLTLLQRDLGGLGTPSPGSDLLEDKSDYVRQALGAIRQWDTRALEEVLTRANLELGGQGMLQRVVAPLTQVIGDLWQRGEVTAAHEHFASAVLKAFLFNATRPYPVSETAPWLTVGTPTGQVHELGAMIVAAAAGCQGWRVNYLGCCLPPAELAGAAVQARARALALSLVYPQDDLRLPAELETLRRQLPAEIALIVGGRAAPAYAATLQRIGATMINDLSQLCPVLDQLRYQTASPWPSPVA